jgi:hypothetical protein
MIESMDSYLISQGCTRYDTITYVCPHPEKRDQIQEEVRRNGYVCVPYEKGKECPPRRHESGLVIAKLITPGRGISWFVAFVPEDSK